METAWYYIQSGRQVGPVALSEVQDLCRSAVLGASDLVWQEGSPSWSAASERSELASAFMPRPQAGPPPRVPGSASDTVHISVVVPRTLHIVQMVLWGICAVVLLGGGLLFLLALAGAESAPQEAAAGAVFSTVFIGAYALARCGEKVSALLLAKTKGI